MDDMGELIGAIAVSTVLFALFALMAWKFWHGHWLRAIAGNNLVSDEEYDSPFQRALGRRAAVVMACCCVSMILLPASTAASAFAGEAGAAVSSVLVGAAFLLIAGPCVWVVVWSNRQARRQRNEMLAADPSKAEDVKLDRKAGVVLGVILGVYLLVVLGVFVVASLAT